MYLFMLYLFDFLSEAVEEGLHGVDLIFLLVDFGGGMSEGF